MIVGLKKGGSRNGTFDQGRVLWREGDLFSSFQVFKFSSFQVFMFPRILGENQHLDPKKV